MAASSLRRIEGWQKPALLLAVAFAMAGLLAMALWPRPDLAMAGATAGDAATYAAIVERMRGGEDYYPAAHAELLAGEFGTRSVFNWRLPLYPNLLAQLPSLAWAQVMLALLGGLVLVLVHRLVRKDAGPGPALAAVALLCGSFAGLVAPSSVLFSEVAAGMLILLSVAAYGLGWRRAGLATAGLALFVRELAGPYVLVCVFLAWRERRWRELLAWAGVLAGFVGYFAWHYLAVQAQLGPADRAYAEGWLQFGGAGFLLAASGFNGVFALLPGWVTALLLPLGVAGLTGWRGGARPALAVGLYLALFSAIGKPFNYYWGALYVPLLTLGLVWAGPVLRLALDRRQARGVR